MASPSSLRLHRTRRTIRRLLEQPLARFLAGASIVERAEQPVIEQRDCCEVAAGEAGVVVVVHHRHGVEVFERKPVSLPQIVVVLVDL